MTPEELEKQPLAGGVAAEEAVEVVEEAEAVEEEASEEVAE